MELTCTGCHNRLRVGDDAIGKRVRCPQCNEIQYIPVEHRPPQPAGGPISSLAGATRMGGAVVETWRMKDVRGNEYGPVPRSELDQWVAEGRVTATCEVMSSASGRWIWASDVYPVLRQGTPSETYAPTSYPTNGRSATTYPATTYPASRYPTAYPSNGYGPNRVPGQSDKSKVVAGLLGLFLGPLGVHRFYLGYPLIGFLMLITLGVCGVWSFIDSLLILLGTVPDGDGRPLAD